ncbi:hypothetical protein SAMN05444274_10762 [Mariniphaga anaerophila]|uniref:Calycin-like beta-barrel domain-containing protein n=1 Tax=Mariniphaga anaerophila TaxID=1484053 RepID=A0A1M5DE94_9BACT|nr:hypothetical protein [Mariniphaga anaerophila]SHF65260.1 hypothetical protein SAMN05444274_10762 [Mariniphaga anaerophila]
MKKSIFNILILLSVFSLTFVACSKDDENETPGTSGKYELVINGNTISKGTSNEIGMAGNEISISKGDEFSILITSVPGTVGNTIDIGTNYASVTILGENLLLSDGSTEMYVGVSGTIKRVSADKITFEGTCADATLLKSYSFSGSVESDVYKMIK